MLLRNVNLVLLLSLMVDVGGMSVSAGKAVSRHDVTATLRHLSRQVPELLSPVARGRQYRRAFRRSLVQIFGMKTRPQRQPATDGGRVPAYMRWLYEESSSGRLPAVIRNLNRRRSGSSPYRRKRHSQHAANTVRSFTGTHYICK